MKKVVPITPNEVPDEGNIPPEVIEVFNGMIADNWNPSAREAVVLQDSAADDIAKKMGVRRDYVFKKNWLDVETLFSKAGWDVSFNHAVQGEDWFKPFFTFKKRETQRLK